ncbi:MAG TPA: acyl-CoA synthetase [Candidatus Sulfotelmatobacter sp.]|nr:acyl-CoA synthetase [Candidatus Sulfotelmatobacter sp.]
MFSLISRAHQHGEGVAVIDSRGTYTYDDLLDSSSLFATMLLGRKKDLSESRVAFAVQPGFCWVAVQWGIWRAGGIAVPLPLSVPNRELEYLIEDSGASTLVYDSHTAPMMRPIAEACGIRALSCDRLGEPRSAESRNIQIEIAADRRAMILYTSGTTRLPKGVVTTHANITAQISSLVEAWEWSSDDRVLLCLPLHHIHGIINVVGCALWSGASCVMLPRFDATAVWNCIADRGVNLVMAVPTIYVKLIAAWEAASPERQVRLSNACTKLRLMVSGSAALPVSILQRWKEISGHTLLERYGMTETGMALSNPLHGERVPGCVGKPLPGVAIQLVAEDGTLVDEGQAGEIKVRGPGVFLEYWRKPDATRSVFRDGWFHTGDTAIVKDGLYRILGRTSSDILKTGGHKVSALEIEEVLREHPAVADCAVVGVPDEEWGERIAAALVLNGRDSLDLPSLRAWARKSLATHKLPSRLLLLDALPRNTMGKVMKSSVVALFQKARASESPS